MPAEIELCETVGITEEEYWQFLELTQAYNGVRPKEYDVLPYVSNSFLAPVAAWLTGGGFYANLTLGLLFTAVSVALTPKPKAPKTPGSLTTGGQTGAKRFAPQESFNSVQELARLGETVPLIFTKQINVKDDGYTSVYGGVRISTRLLWSQMITQKNSQQLKALFMIGLGNLHQRPDYEGYAIGDLLLKNYVSRKIALYVDRTGGRINENAHRYSESKLINAQTDRNGGPITDVMSVDWDQADDGNGAVTKSIASGTRAPSTQVQFGAFVPMPNAMRFRLPYELIMKQKDMKDSVKNDQNRKRNRIRSNFPHYASFQQVGIAAGSNSTKRNVKVNSGDRIRYKVYSYDIESQFDTEKFKPWGLTDVASAINSRRDLINDNLTVGEMYLCGTALAVLYRRDLPLIETGGDHCNFFFRAETDGQLDTETKAAGAKKAIKVYDRLTLQKAAVGTVSNNRACQVTEIGLKSRVFKQITSFPNVNSHPGAVGVEGVNADTTDGVVKKYQDDNASIALGGMSKYINRFSFFRLQARVAGTDDEFAYIDEAIPFCIKGNSPTYVYNFIRINHICSPLKQFEFRFLPFPGNLIKRNFIDRKTVRILDTTINNLETYSVRKHGQDFDVYYSGEERILSRGEVSNKEWYLGDVDKISSGRVKKLDKNATGTIPQKKQWVKVESRNMGGGSVLANPNNSQARIFSPQGIGSKNSTWRWGHHKKGGWQKDFQTGRMTNETTPENSIEVMYQGYKWKNGPFLGRISTGNKNRKGNYFGINRFEYKLQNVGPHQTFKDVDVIGGSGTGLKIEIKVFKKNNSNKFAAARWHITSKGIGYKSTDKVDIPQKGLFKGLKNVGMKVDDNDFVTEPWYQGRNLNPYDAIADFYQYDAERSSHQDGPEHQIVYVNEQTDMGKDNIPEYRFEGIAGLATCAIRLNSSKEWSNFSSLSAYIKKGIEIKRLINDKGNTVTNSNLGTHGVTTKGLGPTNNFAEIVHALLTEKKFGLAGLIGVTSVDKDRLITSAKFCEANKFYWDGVIVDKFNIRDFIYQNSIFNLLDFSVIGGKFSLYPSVPFDSNFVIDETAKPTIRALFTDGNTRNLKVTFLSPEERENFIGVALYRKETPNGFAETKSITYTVKTEGVNDVLEKRPIETFDMSSFCTNDQHARIFLQYILKLRELVDHGIMFETTPQAALGLQPGEYIRFISEITHTKRFENGIVSEDGLVQSIGNTNLNGKSIYYWKPGTEEVKTDNNFKVNNGVTKEKHLFGAVFTVKDTSEQNRVYKIESITYTEEGFIQVSASHIPLLDDGSIATINYDASDFTSY